MYAELARQKDLAAQDHKALTRSLHQSHTKLGDALIRLNDDLRSLTSSLEAERRAREEHDALLRSTIKALNLHWLKRFIWGGGALLLLQLVAYAFLASKIEGL